MFSKKNMQGLTQKYQQLTAQMEQLQVEGSAGSGLVKVKLNGQMELLSVVIDPKCVDPSDVDLLQDLIKAAFEDAKAKVQAQMSQIMPSFPGM